MSEELAFLPLKQQAELVRLKRVSPVELVQMYLDRIDQINGTLNAFITVCPDQALASARQAESDIANGHYLGPMHGIPYAVKDQMLINGVRVTGGSLVFEHHTAHEDATVVGRLREAGGILLGTLNTMEFHIGTNVHYPFGTPRNPWHMERTPGGSSSGSAAAVAAGLCPMALGGDTGGSIRTPASFCGVVGLRPTWGRVSRFGVFPLAWSLDCIGPLARTAEDAAIILEVIAGRDAKDPTTSFKRVPDLTSSLAGSLAGIRMGVVQETTYAPEIGAKTTQAIEAASDVFRTLGAQVESVSIPLVKESRAIHGAIVFPEAASYHRSHLQTDYEKFDYNTRVSLLVGAALPAAVFTTAQRARVALARQLRDTLARFDILLGATTKGGAPSIPQDTGIRSQSDARSVLYGGGGVASGQHTRAYAMAGVPAMSIPCGFDDDGMPLGLHLASRPFQEVDLLRTAYAYQQVTEWHQHHPAAL